MFFQFLVNETLHEVQIVVVTTTQGSWSLHDTIILVLEDDKKYQILIDENTQVIKKVDNNNITVAGYYDDLLSYELTPQEIGNHLLPSRVKAVTEFKTPNGKVLGCEIELDSGAFAILMDPEDIEFRNQGSLWEHCRVYAVPQLGQVIISQERSQSSP